MLGKDRLRRLIPTVTVAALAIALAACTGDGVYPNTTFEPKTDLGRAIDDLWNLLLVLGTIVFVLVEAALLFVVWKYRHRGQTEMPPQVHGSVKLEVLWTLIPAAVLVFIAVPTVRTIFETQAPAPRDALRIEVIGHQWWWEFRYPEYEIITANEMYLPIGRAVNFELRTRDVIHSFWIPQLGAKRDVVSNRTNYVWFTADSTPAGVWNGFCMEYCGASHANMHFRVFTVAPEEFESWAAAQAGPAAFGAAAPPAPGQQVAGPSQPQLQLDTGPGAPTGPPTGTARTTEASVAPGFVFPADRFPQYAVPSRPLPGVAFDDNLVGDPARGQQTFSSSACIGCHMIRGNPMAIGTIGPNLTHFGSRYTLAAGMYPNDARHLARWIKNAPRMKPGSLMQAFGRGEFDRVTGAPVTAGGLDDQQIADIVAYLRALR